MKQFRAVVSDIMVMRAHWLGLAPSDDPMHIDEPAFRILEAEIMADLADSALACTRVVKMARVGDRQTKVLGIEVLESHSDTRVHCLHLSRVANQMKKSYCAANESMRREPNPAVLAKINTD